MEEIVFDLMAAMIFCSYTKEFNRGFKKDPESLPYQAIPLSRDKTAVINDWLVRDITKKQIYQAINLISQLKASKLDGMHVTF